MIIESLEVRMWMVNYAAPGVAIAGLGVTYYALMRKDLDLDRQNHQDYVAYILEILEKSKEDGDPNGCGVSPNEGGGFKKSRSSEFFTASKFQGISLNEELRLQQHSKHSIRSRSVMPGKRRPLLTTSASVPLTPPSNIISSSTRLLTELSRTRKPLSVSDTNLKTKNENTTNQRLRRNQDVLNSVTCTDTKFTNLSQLVTGDAGIKIDNAVSSSNFSKIFASSNSNISIDSISASAATRKFEAGKIVDSELENVSTTSTSSHSSDSLAISLSPSESISQNFENDIVTMQNSNNVCTDINFKENEGSSVQYFDRLEFQSSDIFACKQQEKHEKFFREIDLNSLRSVVPLSTSNSCKEEKSSCDYDGRAGSGSCGSVVSKDNSSLSYSIIRQSNLEDIASSSDVDLSDCESVVKNESVITVIRSSSPVSCYFSNPRYGQRFACRNSDQLANANATGDITHCCKNRGKDKCTSKSTSRSVINFKEIRNSGAILSLSDPTFERHDRETPTSMLTTSGKNENDEMNYDGSLYVNFNDVSSAVSRRVTKETQQRPRASKINMKLKQHSDPVVQGYTGTGVCCHSTCGHRDSTQFLLPPVLSDSIMSTCVEDPVGKLEDINSFGSAGNQQQPYSKSFDYLHLHELAVEHILKDHNDRLSSAMTLVDRIQSLPDILQRDNRYGSVPSWISMNTQNRSVLVPNTWLNWKSVKVFLCSKGFSLKIFDGFENTSASLFKIGILVVTTLTVIVFLFYYLITILNPPEVEPPPPVQLSSWHW